uniref:Uncharacterized protein LOC102809962 n=1 Tax=Saccoglossus kowalevskii TaxID=10224 RepID=A0ABM0M1L6_SACKO|nr:PREDICTED: uncharacterized protein LOC102809962 [Saccoglossus kowalevskii]
MTQDKGKTMVSLKTGIYLFGFMICVFFTSVCIVMTSWVVVKMQEQQNENMQYRSMVDELLVRVVKLEETVLGLSGGRGISRQDHLLTVDKENVVGQNELINVKFNNSLYSNHGLPAMKSNNNSINENSSYAEINIQDGPGTLYIRWGRKTCPARAELVYNVCLVNSRSRVLMVPARNECPSEEWTREYHGYLMTQRHSFDRSEFICVDRYPEARPGSVDNHNGALLYPVEARCGSLPRGPYIEGYEITCAVCTI